VKILWVKSGGLLPLDTGGKIRSYNLLRELARRQDVSVFTHYPRLEADPHGSLREFCREAFLLPLTLPARASAADMLAYARNLFTSLPYAMVKYGRPEVAAQLRQLLTTRTYDAIICDFLLTAAVIPWELRCPKIVFTHNVEATIWERHWRVSRNPLMKLVSWREYRTMARVEREYLKRADHVLTVSDADRAVFAEFLAPERITTVPTGVDLEYFRTGPTPEGAREPTLVFTGSMDWLPNEDAILYFVREILPLIRARAPEVRLSIVGRRPSKRLRALAESAPGIEVTGEVPDIRPYVQRAAVYVVPLRIGGGTRIKIFEAMAMGKPVVSTRVGAEGLPVTHGTDILLADPPQEFASLVLGLLADSEAQRRLGQAARLLVESRYSWSAVAAVLDSAVQQV
jgi:sugar transferase (PEP-CTERM/EpsH1 system associated)